MYQKVAAQSDSLKSLWAAKMNLKGTAILATDADIAEYDRHLHALEQELERRKEVGHRFNAILTQQEYLAQEDEKAREAHQVGFNVKKIAHIRMHVDFLCRENIWHIKMTSTIVNVFSYLD